MKKMFNVFAILLAVCLAAAFVSCKNDDDDDDASVVAVWKSDSTTATFYDDNTVSVAISEGTFSGTYSGDATATSGTVTVSVAGENGRGVLVIYSNFYYICVFIYETNKVNG